MVSVDQDLLDRVTVYMLGRYPAAPWDATALDGKINAAIDNLKNVAKPGYPYQRWFGSNIEVINFFGKDWLFRVVKERFLRIQEAPPEAFTGEWSAAKCVAEGLCDPIRVFIKNELHSQKKVDAGRWRTIWSMSVVDQCVQRVLAAKQNQAEKTMWKDIFSKPGMGLHDEGLKEIVKSLIRMKRPAGTDVTGWDMAIELWALDWDADMRAMLAGFQPGDTMWKRSTRLMSISLLVFSDGFIAEQMSDYMGLIKSGAYITSSSGSKIRIMFSFCATGNIGGEAGAMGDDCFEDLPVGWTKQQLVEAYARLGLNIKVVETFEHDGAVEFCSYRFFPDGTYQPCNVTKKVLNFFYRWPAMEDYKYRRETLANELRHCPGKDQALEKLDVVCRFMSERGGAQKLE